MFATQILPLMLGSQLQMCNTLHCLLLRCKTIMMVNDGSMIKDIAVCRACAEDASTKKTPCYRVMIVAIWSIFIV